jgi:selenide, water dikinase
MAGSNARSTVNGRPSLLDMCDAGGCGSKLPFAELEPIVAQLMASRADLHRPQILDDFGDAAVQFCPLTDTCLITTLDFGTPVSEDPYTWGYIAAQNAMSDVYAVGGTPSTALSILGWPSGGIAGLDIHEVFAGALAAVTAASVSIVGGHSLISAIPFFGLSVTGFARKADVRGNSSGKAGMRLCLTKRVGSGLAIAGRKARILSDEAWAEAEALMKESNAVASQGARRAGIGASTDITGYGVLGHAHMLGRRSGVAVELWPDAIPTIGAVREALVAGIVPSSAERLMIEAEEFSDFANLPPEARLVLCDPQTSGGLMLAGTEEQMATLGTELTRGTSLWCIGRLLEGAPGAVTFSTPPASAQRCA